MTFWNKKELVQIHIELTNACNAACPMCPRFHNNSPLTRPDLEIGQITLEKFKQYFPEEILRGCNLILFCGVHGDPGMAKDLLEICKYIDSVSNAAVRVHTNGGMRTPMWWKELGELFASRNYEKTNYWTVTFSIDGLEDTNHLYRRNVKWDKVMENAAAFISGGGFAIWDYLIFRHNEHQLTEATELAKKMGFRELVPKKALGVDNGRSLTKMPAVSRTGELEYFIEAPLDPENRNLKNPEQPEQDVIWYPFSKDSYKDPISNTNRINWFRTRTDAVYEVITEMNTAEQDSCSIHCKSESWRGGKEIFVDNFGRVIPCCYIGTHLNNINNEPKIHQLHKHVTDYGWDHFDLNKHSLVEILDGEHLDRVYADSWTKETVQQGRLLYCAETCGKNSSLDKILTHTQNNKVEQFKNSVMPRGYADAPGTQIF